MNHLQDRYSYIAIFHYADDGISISFPDLPGCCPCASDTEEALSHAKEALGLHLWGIEQDEEVIPLPSAITELHLGPDEVPVLIDVFMPPIRERINQKFVKKTLSLPAWLAAKAEEDGVNCSKLFQNALMDYLGITRKPAAGHKTLRGRQ